MTYIIHSATLAILGVWLLVYRLLLRTRFRWAAERLTTMAAGVALAMLAPLLPFPPEGFRALTLAAVGMLLSACHPAATALVVTVTLSLGLGGFLWHLGLCSLNIGAGQWYAFIGTHAMVLTLVVLVLVPIFVCVPGVAGPVSLIYVLVPALGALMLSVGISGIWPQAGGIAADVLLSQSPCDVPRSFDAPVVQGLAAWLILTVFGVVLQFVMRRLAQRQAEKAGNGGHAVGGDLLESLLPDAEKNEGGGGANLPRPNDAENRYALISKAIFLDEGADLSHLTENERKLVEICRKDEFERDRILWGGGLI